MATSNEMYPESRDEEIESADKQVEVQTSGGADLESRIEQIEPFAHNDPYLPTRIAETRSQTEALLSELSAKPVGFEKLNRKQIRRLHQNDVERASWPTARQDAFNGILRLGVTVPSRAKRLL